MKRLATAIVLLLAVLVLCIFTQWQLNHLADGLTAQVDHFSLCAGQNDMQGAAEAIAEARLGWRSRRALLGSILPHTELDEVDRLFEVSIQAAKDEDITECRLRAAELSALLRHLPGREFPALENIF